MQRSPNVRLRNAETADRLKIQTVCDLITDAKAHPAKLNGGSGGNGGSGSVGHLAGEIFKAFAVTILVRSPALPDVPPVGYTLKGFAIDTWWGLVAPTGTPKAVIAKLNQAFVAALNTPEAQRRFAGLVAEPVPSTPEQFGSFMLVERVKYRGEVKPTGARVD